MIVFVILALVAVAVAARILLPVSDWVTSLSSKGQKLSANQRHISING